MIDLAFDAGPCPANGREVHVWRDEFGVVAARAFEGQTRWLECPGVGIFEVAHGAASVPAWPGPGSTREKMRAFFRARLLPIIVQACGGQALHASAVAGPSGAIALCGRSHSGKSTLAYALSSHGATHIADDGVVVEATANGPVVWPMPFRARLRPEARAHFPEAALDGADEPGAAIPLTGVFVLAQSPDLPMPMRIERIPATHAFSTLVTHAHCFNPTDPDEVRRLVDTYTRIADAVPVIAITYRPGLATSLDALMAVVRPAIGLAGPVPVR